MAAWSDGYVTEVQYTANAYAELAPGFLAFACLRQGVRPPDLGPGAAYLELGCGQGFNLNLLAAANPGMAFWGVDFHPGQIANARRLARAAGLNNVTFEDYSFEQLLALPAGQLPSFDVIALHGVMSWVNPANRARVVQILDRLLKPGGMAYVSYNCMPGWAPNIALQRFIADYVAQSPGDPQIQVVAALRAALQMLDDHAAAFENLPSLRRRIETALGHAPAYLVHEYLNDKSQPLFHADLARELQAARLSFAASANIADDLVKLAAPEALRPAILEAGDPIWRETLLDYASAKPFRRDIFIRGRNDLSARERGDLLDEIVFTLLAPPEEIGFEFPVPVGNLKGQPAIYQAIIDALADGPCRYGDLRALPVLAGRPDEILRQAITLLVGGQRIHPAAAGGPGAEPAQAFNRALLDRLTFDETPRRLAAPLAGTSVRVEFWDLWALKALAEGREDIAKVAAEAWDSMVRIGLRLIRDGETLTDPADSQAELIARMTAFNTTRLPLFRRLGVISD